MRIHMCARIHRYIYTRLTYTFLQNNFTAKSGVMKALKNRMHLCICVYMFVCMCMCVCLHAYGCAFTNIFITQCVWARVEMNFTSLSLVFMHVCVYVLLLCRPHASTQQKHTHTYCMHTHVEAHTGIFWNEHNEKRKISRRFLFALVVVVVVQGTETFGERESE